jgi:hypothetical protein
LNRNWVHSLPPCGVLNLAIHRAPKLEGLDCRDTPLRSSAVDEVDGLPRGGKPRVKIFILNKMDKNIANKPYNHILTHTMKTTIDISNDSAYANLSSFDFRSFRRNQSDGSAVVFFTHVLDKIGGGVMFRFFLFEQPLAAEAVGDACKDGV